MTSCVSLTVSVNPLSPKGDQHGISPYYFNALENREVMRMEYLINEMAANSNNFLTGYAIH